MDLITLDVQGVINQIDNVTAKGVYDVNEAKNRIVIDVMGMRELEFITSETYEKVIEYILQVKEW